MVTTNQPEAKQTELVKKFKPYDGETEAMTTKAYRKKTGDDQEGSGRGERAVNTTCGVDLKWK